MSTHTNPAIFFLILFILVALSQICNANENRGYVLYAGQKLNKGDTLKYGNYTLKFKFDCRLVLSDTGKQIWASSNRPFDERCRCSFEYNGNLVIYSPLGYRVAPIWMALPKHIDPRKAELYALILQKDRNLVIYGPALWQTRTKRGNYQTYVSSTERYVLYDGETINPGEFLKNGKYKLIMQKDCDLVLYDNDTPLWSTKTAEINNNCICKLKSDGNLIVYKTWDVRPIWSALPGRSWHDEGHYALVLKGDGNLVLYDKPSWSTGTHIVKALPAMKVHKVTAETNVFASVI